jgi:hypothetical protein
LFGRIDGKGTFSTGGAEPVLSDRRVRFFRGWFADGYVSSGLDQGAELRLPSGEVITG